jgi:hypothetical protein
MKLSFFQHGSSVGAPFDFIAVGLYPEAHFVTLIINIDIQSLIHKLASINRINALSKNYRRQNTASLIHPDFICFSL